MKILVDRVNEGVEEHAQAVVAELRKQGLKPSIHNLAPIGVAHTRAKFPIECDDCGEMYWARDPYGSHRGCRGEQKGAGFR